MSRIVGVGAKKKVEKTYTAKEFEAELKKASKETITELETANKKIEELSAELKEANAKIQELTDELEAKKADNGANKGTENK